MDKHINIKADKDVLELLHKEKEKGLTIKYIVNMALREFLTKQEQS